MLRRILTLCSVLSITGFIILSDGHVSFKKNVNTEQKNILNQAPDQLVDDVNSDLKIRDRRSLVKELKKVVPKFKIKRNKTSNFNDKDNSDDYILYYDASKLRGSLKKTNKSRLFMTHSSTTPEFTTYFVTYPTTYPSTYSSDYSNTYSSDYSNTYSSDYSSDYSSTYSSDYSSDYSSTYSGDYSSDYSTTYSSSYSTTYPPTEKTKPTYSTYSYPWYTYSSNSYPSYTFPTTKRTTSTTTTSEPTYSSIYSTFYPNTYTSTYITSYPSYPSTKRTTTTTPESTYPIYTYSSYSSSPSYNYPSYTYPTTTSTTPEPSTYSFTYPTYTDIPEQHSTKRTTTTTPETTYPSYSYPSYSYSSTYPAYTSPTTKKTTTTTTAEPTTYSFTYPTYTNTPYHHSTTSRHFTQTYPSYVSYSTAPSYSSYSYISTEEKTGSPWPSYPSYTYTATEEPASPSYNTYSYSFVPLTNPNPEPHPTFKSHHKKKKAAPSPGMKNIYDSYDFDAYDIELEPEENLQINENVYFKLWNRNNSREPEVQKIEKKKNIEFKRLLSSDPAIFVIHGTIDAPQILKKLRQALLAEGLNNVIEVDWTSLTQYCGTKIMQNTNLLGKYLAQVIDEVRKKGVKYVHVVAHGAGNFIAATAANSVKLGKIDKITGLDPLFRNSQPNNLLSKKSAKLVEIVHTSGGHSSVLKPMGHRDFYINGGRWPQPGCIKDVFGRCSSRKAYQIYLKAIQKPNEYKAEKCYSFRNFNKQKCLKTKSLSLWNKIKGSHGIYFLETGDIKKKDKKKKKEKYNHKRLKNH